MSGPITLSGDGRVVLGSSPTDGRPTVLDLRTGRTVTAVAGRRGATVLALDARGAQAVTATPTAQIEVWDTRTMRRTASLTGHTGRITAGRFLPDGRLATSAHDGGVLLWQLDPRYRLASPGRVAPFTVAGLALSADGSTVLAQRRDGRIEALDPDTATRRPLPGAHPVGAALAVALRGAQPGGGQGELPRSTLAAVGSSANPGDGVARLWAGTKAALAIAPAGGRGPVPTVALSPDGRALAAVARGRVEVVDTSTARPLGPVLALPTCDSCVLAFQADRRLLAAGAGNRLIVYDVPTGRAVLTSTVGGTMLTSLAVVGSDRVVAGTLDGRVWIWQVGRGLVSTTVARHAGAVQSVATSPDRRMRASAGVDGVVQLWDADTGRPLGQPLPGPRGAGAWTTFRPDGRLLVVYGDGTTMTWRLDPASWLPAACRIAGRDITSLEWEQLALGTSHRSVCLDRKRRP